MIPTISRRGWNYYHPGPMQLGSFPGSGHSVMSCSQVSATREENQAPVYDSMGARILNDLQNCLKDKAQ